jgi:hypothetical protein
MFPSFMRRSCSQCGGQIEWLTLEQAQQDAQIAKDLEEASRWIGEPVKTIWRCLRPSCQEVGFFGAMHVG